MSAAASRRHPLEHALADGIAAELGAADIDPADRPDVAATFAPLDSLRPADASRRGPRLIGIMGFAGAGKSEVARRLREAHGFETPHIKAPFAAMFAALLADIGYDAPTIARTIDGDLKREIVPELGHTSTAVQQMLGTEFGRRCLRPDIWADLWCRKVDRILASGGRVALESTRFADEAAAIAARGGILVEIRCPGFGPVNGHASEAIPAVADIVIENDGTIDDLWRAVDAVAIG